VELKGHGLKKAIGQIDSSITKLLTEIQEFEIHAGIL
jgi:hypothetical protein